MAERRRLFGRVVAQSEKGTFMSVVQAQLATVQAQLAEVEAAITEAKAHYRLAALDAALDPAKQEVADAAIAALDALHRRRQMLQEALVLAEEREVSRVDERDAKDRAAKARALSQHLAAFEKAGQAIADAQETLQYKFSAAMKAAQSAAALLPNHLRWAIEYLSADFLRQLMAVEFYRVGQHEVASIADDRTVPVRLREYEHPRTGQITPLTEIISQQIGGIKKSFDPTSFASKPKPAAVSHPAFGEPAGVVSGDLTSAGTHPSAAMQSAAEGDYLPKIQGEPEGDPRRPGDPNGVQPGGPQTSYFQRVGASHVETAGEAVQQHEPVPGA